MASKSADPTPETDDFERPLGYPEIKEKGSSLAIQGLTLRTKTGSATFTREELKQLSFSDLTAQLGVQTAGEELGKDQFGPILENKEALAGVPLVIVAWEFHDGSMGNFVSMYVLTKDERRFIVNDGSTGIHDQLKTLTDEQGVNSMLVCEKGFRVSRYQVENPKTGAMLDAETWYIDTKVTA
jgi:hypothetical protein